MLAAVLREVLMPDALQQLEDCKNAYPVPRM